MSIISRFVAQTHAATSLVARVDYFPDGTTGLIFRLLDDGRADLHVLGPRRRVLYKRSSSPGAVAMVVFRPGGGYPFFGVPLGELADRVVPLRDLWGARADNLLDTLVQADTNAQRLAEMERALVERLSVPNVFEPVAVPVVREALALLSMPPTTVREVAGILDVSERNLRRVFAAVVGLSPNRYARIVRFQKAVARASQGSPRWSEIAVDSGYYDQAHMCADFRDITQTSPADFLRTVVRHQNIPAGGGEGCQGRRVSGTLFFLENTIRNRWRPEKGT